jgi:hypothetical protein
MRKFTADIMHEVVQKGDANSWRLMVSAATGTMMSHPDQNIRRILSGTPFSAENLRLIVALCWYLSSIKRSIQLAHWGIRSEHYIRQTRPASAKNRRNNVDPLFQ